MVINEILILSSLFIWIMITAMAYEFYTTAKENRFRFRYWFSIGTLNIFHLILATIVVFTGDLTYQTPRWLAFVLIDVLFLELFITPIVRRRLELIVRSLFYFNLILDFTSDHPAFAVINVLILIWLARNSDYNTARSHFVYSLIIYLGVIVVPFLFGYTQEASLLIGLLFSTHLFFGIKKLYNEEKTNELIKENIRLKLRGEKNDKN